MYPFEQLRILVFPQIDCEMQGWKKFYFQGPQSSISIIMQKFLLVNTNRGSMLLQIIFKTQVSEIG